LILNIDSQVLSPILRLNFRFSSFHAYHRIQVTLNGATDGGLAYYSFLHDV
jgi:hypothetical protein